jgi:putative aldouronate transport system permease protein
MKGIIKSLKLQTTWPLHVMLLPIIVLLIIFSYIPMVGLSISFQDYIPTKGFFGSDWIGLDNYKFLFSLNDFPQIIRNTLVISIGKIGIGILVSLIFAILLAETNIKLVRKYVQTFVFLPYFLSWVILGGLFIDVFSIEGAVNQILSWFGMESIYFLGNPFWFVVVIIATDVWKVFGYNMIIYYSSILNIDPALYESATIDGAGRLKQIMHITIPGILPIIMVMGMLALGNILNAGFDQIFNMYNPLVFKTGDILDTYIYRMGIISGQYSFATAVGLFKSVIGMILIIICNWAANRFAGYKIL